MNVSAIIVTRGDVNLDAVVEPIPEKWESMIWDNGRGELRRRLDGTFGYVVDAIPDLGAYGRYAAIKYASGDLIYVQDDDCIVSDPQAIVDAWDASNRQNPDRIAATAHVVCNMPPSRTDYADTVLIGWGAVFHRDAPERAFEQWRAAGYQTDNRDFEVIGADFVFPMLTPHIRIDAEHEDLPWAHAPNRTWSLPGYEEKKQEFLRAARAIRDGS